MCGFNYCRVLLFIVAFYSGVSSASTLNLWDRQQIAGVDTYAASHLACNAYKSSLTTGQAYAHIQETETTWNCGYTASGTRYYLGIAVRYSVNCPYGDNSYQCNDSCDAPKTMVNGQCVTPAPDECPGKTGVSSPFSKSGSFNDGYYSSSGGWGAPAQDGCFGGCTASTVDQKCTGNLKTSTYKCRGTMTYTGANCTTSPAPAVDETTDTSRPEPEAYKDHTPCNYTAGPAGSLVCTSSNTEGKEGQSCGTVNGVQTCIDTKPTQNGIEISTKIETTTNADGSTTTTKTDTANSTNCTGINQCTSSSTTTTTTTVKDGNGNTTSVTGSCTGAQCPDENTNPDGDGDGFGDCIGDECGEGGAAGVEGPELEEVPGYADSLGSYWDDIQGAPIVAAVMAISLPAGGNCPVYTETIEYIGTVSTATACDLAAGLLTPLHYLFLAIWAFVAVRTTMTA